MGNAIRLLALALLLPGALSTAVAADLPVFRLELNDGKISSHQINVPAGVRFKIEIVNKGKTAAEFESLQLRKEKVLAPGADSFVVLGPLSPGQYKFYDEFHMATTQGVIVVK
ncbi:cupredoxin domain-containing protein [Vogesella sp. LIG4]|uniref:cupredoxin domain-containing protein n=1 Tax=Vogesella sp. LIG4 TaxID=1192162 RepID=UPI00082020EB|nr:cupredoxin domain-containing protein [Vogesella sp. LIG4]SCK30678.1 Cupredoxin-like domain-containing protein [Vogesella sp. LIG4]